MVLDSLLPAHDVAHADWPNVAEIAQPKPSAAGTKYFPGCAANVPDCGSQTMTGKIGFRGGVLQVGGTPLLETFNYLFSQTFSEVRVSTVLL